MTFSGRRSGARGYIVSLQLSGSDNFGNAFYVRCQNAGWSGRDVMRNSRTEQETVRRLDAVFVRERRTAHMTSWLIGPIKMAGRLVGAAVTDSPTNTNFGDETW